MKIGNEDFLNALTTYQGLSGSVAAKVVPTLRKSVSKFVKAETKPHEYLKSSDGKICRQISEQELINLLWRYTCLWDRIPSQVSAAERQRKSRERKKMKAHPEPKAVVSQESDAAFNLMRHLLFENFGELTRGRQYMTHEQAAEKICEWFAILGLIPKSETSKDKFRANLKRIYRRGTNSQVPGRPRGVVLGEKEFKKKGVFSTDSADIEKFKWSASFDRSKPRSKKK
jgi:hypothetical protein